ncbi:hypothetical protein J3B02_000729 [Coemansia erecta]|uniref:Uncharacterized protein n=1 Tax=Coemansia asiatica TaxID=1052880 RepID=A0A9W7XNA4_9FUNG|nr:hypothetical protein LPJ64_000255 [Coemansia asiatica]KAJ2857827.1 hypothetical protein J3B02_000729 [Coemansia erecta]KAJ2886468.1 hypothetical protein FB639_001567 [Coemansia asiatica]
MDLDIATSDTRTDTKRPLISGSVKKRKPLRTSTSRSDIYVTRERRKFNSQLNRARKLLLDRHFPLVTIHGMGAAIQQAVMLANALKASLADQVTMDVTSDTVTLYDDVVPDDPNANIVTQKRQTSAIHIKVALTDDLQKTFKSKRSR